MVRPAGVLTYVQLRGSDALPCVQFKMGVPGLMPQIPREHVLLKICMLKVVFKESLLRSAPPPAETTSPHPHLDWFHVWMRPRCVLDVHMAGGHLKPSRADPRMCQDPW